MKKEIKIEGMTCAHCQARVEKALNALPGVKAEVNLQTKSAVVTLAEALADDVLLAAVREAGYEPVSIREKKSLLNK
ncbi:MAG: heavy-metal-associated domain-containing protein [Saccharofermentanales bacterium]